MSFDKDTRNRLAKMVAACRRRLIEDVTDQLRGVFGLHPDGTVLPLEKLTYLTPDQATAARRLRDLLDHYAAGAAGKPAERTRAAYERMVLEISFTILNRLAALRLCEERGLVVECVRKGTASDGFRLFERISGGALGTRYDAYRVFLECLFDELALDLGILFDRFTPQSAVFPTERCLEDVLAELNKPELAHLWTADETIGWIYQYFNPPEERRAMREASHAPRNSRELAVRNQFFTPRYVVEFLTDNTLGRIWYEMRKGDTALEEECRYLVRRPNEVFLGPGEKAPDTDESDENLSQEELLKKPVYIEHRPKKDPRDLKVLDPACGSGHFLLYAFDLLERIYEEAWEDPESPKSEITGRTLREHFETLDDLFRAVPKLIIEHNLHGIDIDPRAVQIAALALWLRAQKSWKRLGLKPAERPAITKSNIVTAEPMPGDEDMRREFVESLKPRVLGQIVDVVFDRMKLAGEAGSLLKIEEEIKATVAEAKRQWLEEPKPEQQILFPGMADPRPKQEELRFDVEGVTDEEFWVHAEERILGALKKYAERAENGRALRRRLFAEDAARGFAFIDLCRKRYDVVLMNPPFGEFSKEYKTQAQGDYPNTYNDIFAAFTERWYWRLNENGGLAAITSRAGFFLTSFRKWRSEFLLRNHSLTTVVDLGEAVMDDAMVESAAYILRHNPTEKETVVIRLLGLNDRSKKLLDAIVDVRSGMRPASVFVVDLQACTSLPGEPIVYWVDPYLVLSLANHPSFKQAVGEVRCGLSTGDNPRFVRLLWEIPLSKLYKRWYPLVMTGSSQPWFSPLLVVVDWLNEGNYLATYKGCTIRNRDLYFRPGFSWTRRAPRFIPYAIPAGCIPSASRYQAYPSDGDKYVALGLTSANVTSAILRFYGEKFKWPNFLVDNLKVLPWPHVSNQLKKKLEAVVKKEIACRRRAYQNYEPFHEFVAPSAVFLVSSDTMVLSYNMLTFLGDELELEVAAAYGLTADEYLTVTRDLREAITAVTLSTSSNDEGDNNIEPEGDAVVILEEDERTKYEAVISYAVGVSLGRWDVRIALDPSLAPKLPDPFDPLPVCPPGMLVGPDGLPAKPGGIVGEEWLRARPDANTLPPEGSVKNPTIADSEYPLRISWDGILVDDPGFNGGQPHRDDIVSRVREVLDLLWDDKAPEIEQEACEILGVADLRDYFRKPSGFFQDHLKRYSKSRRKAPIYWPLSTASGSYTIWLYYHRLTDQTLYAAVNKYVDPKIAEVERALARIKEELTSASGRDAARLRDRLNEGRTFLGELRDLREELLRIAALPYRPDLNDGVIINAAPFHRLFRLRQWAKDTEDCWRKLEKGEYDWAHLAYTIWPDRVREVCKKDRSIAIAHGLEELWKTGGV